MSPSDAERKNAVVQSRIVRALKQHKVRVVTGKRIDKVFQEQGLPSAESDWVLLARKLKVEGFVTSTFSRAGSKQTVEVAVRNGADGSVSREETFAAKGKPKRLAAVVGRSFWKKLGPSLKQTAAPTGEDRPSSLLAASTPAETSTAGKVDEPSSGSSSGSSSDSAGATAPTPSAAALAAATPQSEAGSGASPAKGRQARDNDGDPSESSTLRASPEGAPTGAADGLSTTYEIEADLRTLRRTFDYARPQVATPHYFLNFNPVAGGRASWYPLRNLGVFVQGEFGAGLKSDSYPTGTREILGGAQFRYPFSFGQLGATVGYFHHAFLIQDTTAPDDPSRLTLPIPNTVYAGGRLAATARIKIAGPVHLTVDAAYRLVTTVGNGVGQLKSDRYFPAAGRPTGLDGSAFLAMGLGSMFEIRGGVDYRRYVFGPLRGTTLGGTTIDASGAVDQYFAISLGVAAVLR